ncbi:MAG: TetR/AcrR family transcriptional regulator [Nitrospiraceae bacterium]|nr:TetR/AcrR family transcriptional regulator [Nitrospiraceae bacterium]
MGVKEKRAKNKEEFRREILNAARGLFINEGYERFSMRRLAEKIDYSATTIYLYFKDKDALLFAICEEFFDRFSAQLDHIRSVSQDPIETLRQALLYLMEFGLKNPDQYKVIFFTKSNIYGTQEEFVEKESMARNTYFAFREMVRDCIKTGRMRDLDVDVIAHTLAITSHGLITMALYKPNFLKNKGRVIAQTVVDGLLRGYQK